MNKRMKKKRIRFGDMIIGDHRYSVEVRTYFVKRDIIRHRLLPVLYHNNHLIYQKNNLKRALRYAYSHRQTKGCIFTYKHNPYSRIVTDTSTKRDVSPVLFC